MRTRIISISLAIFVLYVAVAAVPAAGQTVYSNGPINGNTDAWTINFGFVTSDTFTVAANNTTITGANFGIFLFPGDTLTSAELSITSGENGGTSYFDQTVNFVALSCSVNQFQDFNVCNESTTFNGPTLSAGTYWINLQNAVSTVGDPVFWDENSGPSSASQNGVGSIPSESFTLFGTSTTTSSTSTTTSVPEPSSILLFGSGILGLAQIVRRRLF